MEDKEYIQQLRQTYRELNRSFKPVLIFHVGESAGFFSEYNCMILAMLYCLQHQIQFRLYSKDANFSYEKGWTDFFEAFCEEEKSDLHHYINMRPLSSWGIILRNKQYSLLKWKLKKCMFSWFARGWQIFHPNTYLTQDVWHKLFHKDFGTRKFNIPELKIDGDLVQACSRLVERTWIYKCDIWQAISSRREKLNIPPHFISCQIRAGDKYVEFDLLSVEVYIHKFKEYPSVKDIFVLTDDYAIIKKLKSSYGEWNWYTLCQSKEHGYIHSSFKNSLNGQKREQLLNFFTSMELLHQSDRFIGTVTSNPSIFASIRDPYKLDAVDYERNLIFLYFYGYGGKFE